MKRSWVIVLLFALTGCATQASWVTFPDSQSGKGMTLDAWLKQHPIPMNQDIAIQELSRGEGDSASSHIVQIRRLEPLHVHKDHDLMAILLKGKGILTLGERQLQVSPGSVISIPRGIPHSFVNKSSEPAVAYAMFTPAFDGKDTVPVQQESLVKTKKQ